MNNIKIKNAKILNFTDENGNDKVFVSEGDVLVKDGTITYVGPSKDTDEEFDRVIDANGNLVMPGFKDAHTHSAMTLFRSHADDTSLQDWLFNQIFPLEAKLTDDFVYWGSRLAILEYLTSGITSNFDMYMRPDAIVKASVDSGFRTVLCGSINDFGGTVEQQEQEYLKYNRKYNKDQSDLISYIYGFHAEYTTGREILEGMAALSKKYKAQVATHNSETEKEVNECIERTGMTPTVYLDSLGMFDYGGCGFHCVHMSDDDFRIFKEKNMHVITNPGSNTKLASGIAPITKMMELGINLGIGTDGAASNNCLDMFREMFLTTGLQKIREKDAAVCDANEVLKMATIGGAKAMELNDCLEIKAGQKADLIIIDLNTPNMQPINNISKNVVYSGSKSNVKLTMVNGKVLYEDGKFFVGVEPEEIYAKCNEAIAVMKKQVSEG